MAFMQNYFYELADYAQSLVYGGEVCLCYFNGEDSDFIRFNNAKVRQAGSVAQRYLSLHLIEDTRHLSYTLSLSGERLNDFALIKRVLESLRATLAHVPQDPYLAYAEDTQSSAKAGTNQVPESSAVLGDIIAEAAGRDFVGIYAAGGIYTGFANSLGQRNWHSSYSFNLDWSFYHQADKAVKASYAGFAWDKTEFARIAANAAQQLEILRKPARNVPPGAYRAYLAPAAMQEIMHMLLDGFSLKAQRSKQSPLLHMNEGVASLNPAIHVRENSAQGVGADFQPEGFRKPAQVVLLAQGRCVDALVSPRSAKEYSVISNGADKDEMPEFLDMAGGELAQADVLKQLDTGVYVNNLWYLNYSDYAACRLTGMTRFATFWVENGEIVAPLNVMRFDDTIYNILGTQLLGLTRERALLLDNSTYEKRASTGMHLPGALLAAFPFTL
jgi:predicted Zn-dependent protease